MLRVIAASFVLMGCMEISDPDTPATSAPTPTPQAPSSEAACAPEVFQRMVGKPESVLHVLDLPENVRILSPNSAATTDHRPDRINIEINAAGVISRVWCG
jgi:hypothetical protein